MGSVAAQGIVLEVGNKHISSCPTYGEVMELQRGKFSNTWQANFIIAGRSSAKSLLTGLDTTTGCTAKEFAFFNRYTMDTNTKVMSFSFSRNFGDQIILNTVPHYLQNVVAIKFEYTSVTQNGKFYVAAIQINKVSDDSFGGTLVQFFDEATDTVLKTTILETTKEKPHFKTAYLWNENPALGNKRMRFAYAVNTNNQVSPMFPSVNTISYHHYAAVPKISFLKTKLAKNSALGVTAFYRDLDIELRASILHYNDDLTQDLTPAIYYWMRGVAEQQSTTQHVCCGANTPGYAVEAFASNTLEANTINKAAYAIALPLNVPSLTRYRVGLGGIGHLVLFTIQFTAAQAPGCQFIQPFGQEILAQHQTAGYFAQVHSVIYMKDHVLRVEMSIADNAADVGKIATDGNQIQEVYVHPMKCINSTSGQFTSLWDNSGVTKQLYGKTTYSLFQASDDMSDPLSFDLSVRVHGSMCTSGSPPYKPCQVQEANRFDDVNQWQRLFYMINAKTQFIYNDPAMKVNDGFSDIIDVSTGQVTPSNGGSNFIMVGTNFLSGITTLHNYRGGIQIRISYKMFYIDRPIFTSTPASTSVNLDPTTNLQNDPIDDNIHCGSFTNTIPGDKYLIQFDPAAFVTTEFTEMFSVPFNPAVWEPQIRLTCKATIQLGMIGFGVQQNGVQLAVQGILDSSSGLIKFEFAPDTAILFAQSVVPYTVNFRITGGTFISFDTICANNGVAWNQPSISTCSGVSQASLDASQNRLFRNEATSVTYWKFNSTTIQLSGTNSATRKCVTSDDFTLKQSAPYYQEYDLINLPFADIQSTIVSNPNWVYSAQAVMIYQFNSDFTLNGTVSFVSNKFQFTYPNNPASAGINITQYLLVHQKNCAQILTTKVSNANFLLGTTTALSPLQPKFLNLNLRFTVCSEIFNSKPNLKYFLTRSTISRVQTLETSIENLFQPPADPMCSIKEWYLSDLGSTTKLPITDPVAIRFQQTSRTEPMDSLKIDLLHSDGRADLALRIRIQVFIRGRSSQTALRILHSNSAVVDVVIGCYLLKSLDVKQIASPSHPAFKQFDAQSAEISLAFISQFQGKSGTIDLATMVLIYTEVSECGPFKLFGFADAGHLTPTKSTDQLSLATNPTEVDPKSGILTPLVAFSFGANAVLPTTIYLRAETNGLGSSVVSKSFKLVIQAGGRQPQTLNDNPVWVIKSGILRLDSFFDLGKSTSEQGYEFFTALEAGGPPITLAGLYLNPINIVTDQLLNSKQFFVAMKDKISQKTAYKEFRLNSLPYFVDEVQLHHQINVTWGNDNHLIQPAVYVYQSPMLSDAENHSLSLDVLGLKYHDFIPVKIPKQQTYFEVTVDRWKVKNSGVYNATVIFGDQYQPIGGIMVLSIEIAFLNETNDTSDQSNRPSVDYEQQQQTLIEALKNQTNSDTDLQTQSAQQHINSQKELDHIIQAYISLFEAGFTHNRRTGFVFRWFKEEMLEELETKIKSKPIQLKNPTLTVSLVSQRGFLSLEFSHPMLLPPDIDHTIYARTFKLLIQPAFSATRELIAGEYVSNLTMPVSGRRLNDLGNTIEALQFNYSVVNQTENRLDFQLQFADPGLVSILQERDRLFIDILRPTDVFKSAQTLQPVQLEPPMKQQDLYYRVIRKIPPQISKADFDIIDPVGQKFNSAFNTLLMQQGLSRLVIRFSIKRLWGLIRTGQLVTFSCLIQVPIPAHTMNFLIQLFYSTKINFFEMNDLASELFTFKKSEPVFDNLKFYSIVDGSLLKHTGSVISLMLLSISSTIVLWICHSIAKRLPHIRCCRKFGRKIYQPNFFGKCLVQIQKIYLESYFILTLCTLISLNSMSKEGISEFYSTFDDCLQSAITWYFLVMAFFYPIFCALFINKHIDDPQVKTKLRFMSILLDNNHHRQYSSAVYEIVFLFRRLVLVIVILFLADFTWVQTHLFVVFSLAKLCYQVRVKPMKTGYSNKVKVCNEACVYLCMMILLQLCDPMSISQTAKYVMGWVMIGLICLVIVVNLLLVAIDSIYGMRLRFNAWKSKVTELAVLNHRFEFRDSHFKHLFPADFEHFQTKEDLIEAYEFVMQWKRDRVWLEDNGYDLSQFENQAIFKDLLLKLNYYRGLQVLKAVEHGAYLIQSVESSESSIEVEPFLNYNEKQLKKKKVSISNQVFRIKEQNTKDYQLVSHERLSNVLGKTQRKSESLAIDHAQPQESSPPQKKSLKTKVTINNFDLQSITEQSDEDNNDNSQIKPKAQRKYGTVKLQQDIPVEFKSIKKAELARMTVKFNQKKAEDLAKFQAKLAFVEQQKSQRSTLTSVQSPSPLQVLDSGKPEKYKYLEYSLVMPLLKVHDFATLFADKSFSASTPFCQQFNQLSLQVERNEEMDLKPLKNLVKQHLPRTNLHFPAQSLMIALITRILDELQDHGDQELVKQFKNVVMLSTNRVQQCLTCLNTVDRVISTIVIDPSDLDTRPQNVTSIDPCSSCSGRQQMHYTHILNNPSLLIVGTPKTVEQWLRIDLQPPLFLQYSLLGILSRQSRQQFNLVLLDGNWQLHQKSGTEAISQKEALSQRHVKICIYQKQGQLAVRTRQ